MTSPAESARSDSNAQLLELEAVTREYARYAGSAGGLSGIAGGVLCLVSYGIGSALESTTPVRLLLIAIPVVWLVLKELVARRLYQRLGRVEEIGDGERTSIRRWLLGAVAAIVLVIVLGSAFGVSGPSIASSPGETTLYLIIVVALPVIAWRWLRTPIDLAIGAFLLCQAALAATGAAHSLVSTAMVFVPAALLMIATGVRDHLAFRALQGRMRDIAIARQAMP